METIVTSADDIIALRLYVAGRLPNARRAVANLEAFCRDNLGHHPRIEVVDVFENSSRALTDGILLTPQLLVVWPDHTLALVGDLADLDMLGRAVGIAARAR